MKNIKIFIAVVVFNCFVSQAQVWVHAPVWHPSAAVFTWSISNVVNVGFRAKIIYDIKAELHFKGTNKKWFTNLTVLEEKYHENKKFKVNRNTAYLIAGTKLLVVSLRAKTNVLNNGHDFLLANASLKYGLKEIGNRLSEIPDEIDTIEASLWDVFYPFSGGTGYNITLTLKLLKQLIVLDNELIDLNFKLDNLDFMLRTFN